jgi:hypothetical protein
MLHTLTLLFGSISPRGDGTLIQIEHMDNSLQWTTIGQKPNGNENKLGWATKPFSHRSSPSSKCMMTYVAAVSLTFSIMDRAIAHIGETTRREHVEVGQNWKDVFIGSVFISIFTER